MMRRKTFLNMAGAALAAVILKGRGGKLFRGEGRKAVCFFVAGVRFHSPIAGLRSGGPVIIRSGWFRGSRSYSIDSEDGRRIGYVPQQFISAFRGIEVINARLTMADYDAVPWKRYEVTAVV